MSLLCFVLSIDWDFYSCLSHIMKLSHLANDMPCYGGSVSHCIRYIGDVSISTARYSLCMRYHVSGDGMSCGC